MKLHACYDAARRQTTARASSFQITSTFSRLTAFQNIRMGVLSRRGIRFNLFRRVDRMSEVTAETDEKLRRINLHGERNFPASVLSYGKHRALEISMALATEPDLVMLDEPTAGMSKDETHYAVDLIRGLTEGRTAVIIEHDMDVVFSPAGNSRWSPSADPSWEIRS